VKRLGQPRGVRLDEVSLLGHSTDKKDSSVDIIAIRSLDTKSLDTLTFKEEGKSDVNYLVNKHILPIEVSNVRIFTCD
jgi:hypothetical protein